MSQATFPRQDYHTARSFIDGMCNLLRAAINIPNLDPAFTTLELEVINALLTGFGRNIAGRWLWLPDYRSTALDDVITNVNTTLDNTSTTLNVQKSTIMALLVRAYNVVNAQARANIVAGTSAPAVLVDIVVSYTLLYQPLPQGDNVELLTAMWAYVTGVGPESVKQASSSSEGESDHPLETTDGIHPVDDISWIPHPSYGVAMAIALDKYYNFDGRFFQAGTAYNVDRAKLVDAILSAKIVILDDNSRTGLRCLLFTFKNPSFAPMASLYNAMIAAIGTETDIITPLDSITQHTITMNGALVSNYMPFRMWFDTCDKNGNSFQQFREGDNTTINQTMYMIKIAGTPWYPTNSITLNSGDSMKVTDIDGVFLTSIVQDGIPQPDIQFTPSGIP